MTTQTLYQDTPSIVDGEITTVRSAETLRYSDLTALEKRDYLFDQGIRATAYENYPDQKRPDVFFGLGSPQTAWRAVQSESLSTTLTRVNDEFELGHGDKIGTITTESEFVASKYGDYRLFFQHAARYIRDAYRK